MMRSRRSFRILLLALGTLTVFMMTAPPEAAAQRGNRGSAHSAGRSGPSGRGHRGGRGGRHHVHHVHHVHHGIHRGPAWHPIGFFVVALATTAIIVSIVDDDGNSSSSGNVYYDQGVYYEKTSEGYKAIPPPKGAQVESLPEGYTSVSAGGKDYGYYQGDFYVQGADGKYIVTSAPVGAIVPYIPDAAEEHQGDTTTYTYNGITYQPVSLDGDTSYLVSATK